MSDGGSRLDPSRLQADGGRGTVHREVDGLQIDPELRISLEHDLLPFDLAQCVVLDDHDLDIQVVIATGAWPVEAAPSIARPARTRHLSHCVGSLVHLTENSEGGSYAALREPPAREVEAAPACKTIT